MAKEEKKKKTINTIIDGAHARAPIPLTYHPIPPHEQLLVVVVRGCFVGPVAWHLVSPTSRLVSFVSCPLITPTSRLAPSSPYLSSTLVSPTLLYPLPIIVPPTIHPTSSCSQGWRRVARCDMAVAVLVVLHILPPRPVSPALCCVPLSPLPIIYPLSHPLSTPRVVLMRLEAGGVLSMVVHCPWWWVWWWLWWGVHHFACCCCHLPAVSPQVVIIWDGWCGTVMWWC
jgi:hypothetical protein